MGKTIYELAIPCTLASIKVVLSLADEQHPRSIETGFRSKEAPQKSIFVVLFKAHSNEMVAGGSFERNESSFKRTRDK